MKKHFTLGVGKYYFKIRNGQQHITICRADKKDATYAFLNYVELGKDIEWLGRWEGKKFSETTSPNSEAA